MDNVTNNQDNKNTTSSKTKVWKIIKWTVLVIVILYAALVAIRVKQINAEKIDAAKVKEIHSIRLTMKDIDEANLPPMPDEAINNATVEGVDVNKNYVRDDVERYIFEKYKTKEERAAWMQYARAMGFVMTKAESKETLKEVLKERDRADMCTLDIYKKLDDMTLEKFDKMTGDIDAMMVNTKVRKTAENKAYNYLTVSSQSDDVSCDLFNN